MNNTHNIASVIITRIMYTISKFYAWVLKLTSFSNRIEGRGLVNKTAPFCPGDSHKLYNEKIESEFRKYRESRERVCNRFSKGNII